MLGVTTCAHIELWYTNNEWTIETCGRVGKGWYWSTCTHLMKIVWTFNFNANIKKLLSIVTWSCDTILTILIILVDNCITQGLPITINHLTCHTVNFPLFISRDPYKYACSKSEVRKYCQIILSNDYAVLCLNREAQSYQNRLVVKWRLCLFADFSSLSWTTEFISTYLFICY